MRGIGGKIGEASKKTESEINCGPVCSGEFFRMQF